MVTTNQLRNEAWEVNDLLTQYVILHNHLLKSAGTFSSLFRKIDFQKLHDETVTLLEKFQEKTTELENLAKDNLGEKERQFFDCLLSYTRALTETVSLLSAMYYALNEKAKGNKLSLKDHLENDKKYQVSIKNYLSYGVKLNNLYKSL
ncbi:MAG: hypothetical protein WC686_02095 [Candidatus Shapirobacteria bacterium]|jgi:hypothetical protein